MTIYSRYNQPTGFYVYAYLRDDNTPWYIGKGKEDRAWSHRNKEQSNTPADHSKIVIMETNLTEVGAFALERRYIRWYGRKNKNTGILRNLTAGGEGANGSVQSPETINKRLETMRLNGTLGSKKGRKIKPAAIAKGIVTRARNGNNKQTPESIAKALDTKRRKGNTKHSPQTVAKMLETRERNGTLHQVRTKESVERGLVTKARNGNNKQTPDSIAKMLESRARNKAMLLSKMPVVYPI